MIEERIEAGFIQSWWYSTWSHIQRSLARSTSIEGPIAYLGRCICAKHMHHLYTNSS